MKHYFLINPVAGKGLTQKRLSEQILKIGKELGIQFELYKTQKQGDATEYVRQICCRSSDPIRFYACGGDGTFQEAVIGALGFRQAEVTVIPCGSGNDFVRSFSVPDDFSDLAKQIDGAPFPCDLLQVNDRYAVNLCNVGFDADIAYDMDKFKKIPFIGGSAAYDISLVFNLLKRLGKKITLQIDDQPAFTVNSLLAAAANGRFYGGGYEAAPLALLNDGVLDLCRVDKISRFRIAGFVRYYKHGKHLETPGLKNVVHYDKCHSLQIKSEKQLRFVLDGEVYSSFDVTINILPAAFTLSVPQSCLSQKKACVAETALIK